MFTCLPKIRAGGEAEGNMGCQRRLAVENRRREEAQSFLIPYISVAICYRL